VVHGVRLERVREAHGHRHELRAELGVSPDEVLVGTIANFRSQKGYPDLLEAARRVLAAAASARFVAVGQGARETEIRRLHASFGFDDRFRLLGYREDAASVLAACDVFVLASLYEGLPLALMEALALGLPVVATAVGGVPEWVSHGVEGLLVPPARPDLLADALINVVDDPKLRRRLADGAALRGEQLDIRIAARRIEGIYREVAGERPVRRGRTTIRKFARRGNA